MLFHYGFLDIEYFMNYDLSFAEEYFKDESNNECMMTPCTYRTQKRGLENNKEKKRMTMQEDGKMCMRQQ